MPREEGMQQPLLVIVQNTLPLYTIIGSKYCRISEVMDVSNYIIIRSDRQNRELLREPRTNDVKNNYF